MEMINFPFIMKFERSFKDNEFIYFLLEYIKGIEMFEMIRMVGLLTPIECKFYVS